ncbi:MAG: dihydropteroate synthase, partial [Gammaproteobacteria bacterium]
STRPGSERVPAEVQKQRVIPVIRAVRERVGDSVAISIDTTLADVAAAAINAGAVIVNDVSAGRDDKAMLKLAAESRVKIVLMHMQGSPGTMQINPVYTDVVDEVYGFLLERAEAAIAVGIRKENIILDPGIGFGKTLEHNLEIIRDLGRFAGCGYPVLLGASRKRFLKTICNNEDFSDLVAATCAVTTLGVLSGIGIFRVHDVKENRQAADVIYRVMQV